MQNLSLLSLSCRESSQTHLLGPGALDEGGVDHLEPALLALDVRSVREVLGDHLPVLIVLLYEIFQKSVLEKGKQMWSSFQLAHHNPPGETRL